MIQFACDVHCTACFTSYHATTEVFYKFRDEVIDSTRDKTLLFDKPLKSYYE